MASEAYARFNGLGVCKVTTGHGGIKRSRDVRAHLLIVNQYFLSPGKWRVTRLRTTLSGSWCSGG